MDKDRAARVVDALLGALRTEIAETTGHAARLGEAVGRNAETRETATALLEKVRARRAERERRRIAPDEAPAAEH